MCLLFNLFLFVYGSYWRRTCSRIFEMLIFFNWINYSSAFPSLRAKSSLRDTCVSLCLFSIFKNQQSRPWRQITNFKLLFFKSFFKCFDFIQAFVEKGQSNQCSAAKFWIAAFSGPATCRTGPIRQLAGPDRTSNFSTIVKLRIRTTSATSISVKILIWRPPP